MVLQVEPGQCPGRVVRLVGRAIADHEPDTTDRGVLYGTGPDPAVSPSWRNMQCLGLSLGGQAGVQGKIYG